MKMGKMLMRMCKHSKIINQTPKLAIKPMKLRKNLEVFMQLLTV